MTMKWTKCERRSSHNVAAVRDCSYRPRSGDAAAAYATCLVLARRHAATHAGKRVVK